jgi:hypothetical protein
VALSVSERGCDMNTNSPEHRPFVEMMPAYVMDGLEAEERAALEAHLAICAACRQTLADITGADRTLAGLFSGVTPNVGFEDRVIDAVREGAGGGGVFDERDAGGEVEAGAERTGSNGVESDAVAGVGGRRAGERGGGAGGEISVGRARHQ